METALLPDAERLTAAKFNDKTRKLREKLHPDSIAVRTKQRLSERAISFQPAADGMAYLSEYMPALEALAVYNKTTHPETGAALSLGRDRYTVPKDLRTWLNVRDGTCRFPGCNRSARTCDIDHTTDWQFGGNTNYDNLASVCPAHHKLKDYGWTATQTPDGVLEWTAPSGRHYVTEPESYISTPGSTNSAKFVTSSTTRAATGDPPPF